MTDPFRVLAVDPGISTGFVLAEVLDDVAVIDDYGQFKADVTLTASQVVTWLVQEDVDVLVLEQFDLRPQNKFLADLTPVAVNAVLDYVSATLPEATWGVVYQTPVQAKTLIPDAALKKLGFWPTGKDVAQPDADDVRDAARHLYRYLIMERGLSSLAAKIAS